MAYTKTSWIDGETELSAEHMNNIENGIKELDNKVTELDNKSFSNEIKILYAEQGANLDNIHETGLYYISAGVTNSPHDYANMLVISRDGSDGFTTQLVMGSRCYLRVYSGSPLQWGSWYRLDQQ